MFLKNKSEVFKLIQKYPLQTGKKNPILRKKSEEIKIFSPFIVKFAKDLIKLMDIYDGVGLAAPQVGKNLRIIAITLFEEKNGKLIPQKKIAMINPKILSFSKQKVEDKEACLSLPGLAGLVDRYQSVTVEYQNFQGNKETIKISGYNARIVQHEIDHLDGILFIDRAKRVWKTS